jgi:hypothetical protein
MADPCEDVALFDHLLHKHLCVSVCECACDTYTNTHTHTHTHTYEPVARGILPLLTPSSPVHIEIEMMMIVIMMMV